MARAGMNVARLNFSHGNYEEFERLIHNIRAVSQKLHIPIAILQDLQGPKIRVGKMPEGGIFLKKNARIILTTRRIKGNAKYIPVQYKKLPDDVKKNNHILIEDGLIELRVKRVLKKDIFCQVIAGGLVQANKGINVPGASIQINPITQKDKKDLIFGIKNDVDYVALSFVKSAGNIIELRKLIRHHHGQARIIAKIEQREAIDNMESIITEADAVMVARGDLGVEIAAEQVPIEQKKIIYLANIHGKPVITATQILESMIENLRPTRAEISDAANAVFDHTDALMLSNETAIGKFPVTATLTLSKVAVAVEHELKKHTNYMANRLFPEKMPVAFGTCFDGIRLALDIGAKFIVAITYSGFTAQHTAKHRSYIPIIAITPDCKVRSQLALVWGIHHVFVETIDRKDHVAQTRRLLAKNKLVKKGDQIVIISNAGSEEKTISVMRI